MVARRAARVEMAVKGLRSCAAGPRQAAVAGPLERVPGAAAGTTALTGGRGRGVCEGEASVRGKPVCVGRQSERKPIVRWS